MARVLSPGEVLPSSIETHQEQEYEQNLNVSLICPDCKEHPPNLVEEFSSGDTVCGSCGRVLSDRVVDTRSEWRTFSNDDGKDVDPSRVGEAANPLLGNDQLSTRVGAGGNNNVSRELQRAQGKSSSDKATKGLLKAYEEINNFCDAHQYDRNVNDTAKGIYKLIDDKKAFKGKSQDALIASCIFIACRQNKVARSFKEITELTRVPKKEIGRTFKAVEKFLQEEEAKHKAAQKGNALLGQHGYKTTESSQAHELSRRYCSHLGLSNVISAVAQDFAIKVQDHGSLAGRSPLSVAAVCIYMASYVMGNLKTPKQIGAVCNVSDGTIRAAYKNFYPQAKEILDSESLRKKGGSIEKLPAT